MSEKTVCLVSGGIDSPVAAAMISREREIVPLHFVLHPYYCEKTFSLSIEALRKLKKVSGFDQIVLFPWGNVLRKIFTRLEDIGRRNYSCVLCRRAMFVAASLVCDRLNASSITTGESVGQKASQTLENLKATSYGVKCPILRPLMGMDKEDIIKRSKELGLWMSEHAGCCNATPERPMTKAGEKEALKLFKTAGLDSAIEEEFGETEIYGLGERSLDEIFYGYLENLLTPL